MARLCWPHTSIIKSALRKTITINNMEKQLNALWLEVEKILDRMIKQNNAIDEGDYKTGFEDALVEVRGKVEALFAEVKKL